MNTVIAAFSVYFEDPFWIGVYERRQGNSLSVAKITFGAEPKCYEVYDFLMSRWRYFSFSPAIADSHAEKQHRNPKRVQREIKKGLQKEGIGTKSQQALHLQHDEGKEKRKKRSQEQKEAEKERQFQRHQEKHKAKHKGH